MKSIHTIECVFDYGAWYVVLSGRDARIGEIHEWLVVALWKAWRQYQRNDINDMPMHNAALEQPVTKEKP